MKIWREAMVMSQAGWVSEAINTMHVCPSTCLMPGLKELRADELRRLGEYGRRRFGHVFHIVGRG